MAETWIMDASPLILLGKAEQLHWIPEIERILIPESVSREIEAGAIDDPARNWITLGEGKQFITPNVHIPEEVLAWDLGSGENSVIAQALAIQNSHAIIDDAAARRCAIVFESRPGQPQSCGFS